MSVSLKLLILLLLSILLLFFSLPKVVYEDLSSLGANLVERCYPTETICYPMESSFYPYPLLALVITILGLFFVKIIILPLATRIIFKRYNATGYKINQTAMIGLLSAIIPLAALFLPFVLNTPLLMYNADYNNHKNVNNLKILLYNFGLVSARNVVISLNTNSSDIRFLNFTSEPLLSQPNNNMTKHVGNAMFNIDSIPPTSETTVNTNVDNIHDKTQIIVYLRSEQWVAYHHLISIIFMYIVGIVVSASIIFWREIWIFYLKDKFEGSERQSTLD